MFAYIQAVRWRGPRTASVWLDLFSRYLTSSLDGIQVDNIGAAYAKLFPNLPSIAAIMSLAGVSASLHRHALEFRLKQILFDSFEYGIVRPHRQDL